MNLATMFCFVFEIFAKFDNSLLQLILTIVIIAERSIIDIRFMIYIITGIGFFSKTSTNNIKNINDDINNAIYWQR